METTFYHDTMNTGNSLKQLKSKMTLDFGQPKAKKLNGLLSSPDLNICTLASPELERIIIQQNGMVTTTPTPTQFLFPKAVTDEQEAYARGFVDALEELHKTHDSDDGDDDSNDSEVPMSTDMTTLQNVQTIQPGTTAVSIAQTGPQSQQMQVPSPPAFSFATTTTVPTSSLHHTNAPMPTVVSNQQEFNMESISRTSSPAQMQPQPMAAHQRIMQLKEEPQTVPGYNGPLGNSPPVSPVNMEVQEVIKLDRKRARNRVAARKCRYRKLERISRLEERVQDLTGQKDDLATNASDLREQVARLKQQIMEHVNSGCKVMLNSNLL